MSVNLDHIDLNSDAVSVELENDVVHAGNLSQSNRVDFPGAETLMVPATSDVKEDNVRELGVADRVANGGFERGIDLEAEIVPVERDGDAKTSVANISTSEVARIEVSRDDKEVKGEDKDIVQVQNASASGSLSGIVDVEVKLISNDFLPLKDHGDPCLQRSSNVVENQPMEMEMEIDEQVGISIGQNLDNPSGVKVPVENYSDEFNLVVDFNPYASSDGNVQDDRNVKAASSKPEFSVSDLVWGKVRSHPWWPGQIFDPSAASKKAKKYFKKDSYLIAYFGDETFAFNEVSTIKPFRTYFLEMEKRSNLEEFHYAVNCALEEVSRRVEFGLACPCMPAYENIRTQIIVNSGIKDEYSGINGVDKVSGVSSFDPVNLVEYVKGLGQLPFGEVDRLEFVTAQAQLLAFNRWKGYCQLPEFQILGELLESDEEISLSTEIKCNSEVNTDACNDAKNDEHVASGKGKLKGQDNLSTKRKRISGASLYPNKKEKSLADLMAEKGSPAPNCKSGKESKLSGRSVSSCSRKKRKTLDSILDESVMKHCKGGPLSAGPDNNSVQPKETYRVGDSILRVASQLNGSTPMLKSVNESFQKSAVKNKSKEKSHTGKSQGKKSFQKENFSPDEMVSQLWLLAGDPMKECSLLASIISFFTEFRNSVCPEDLNSQQFRENILDANIETEPTKSETNISKLEQMKDSYWTDRVIQTIPKENLSLEHQNEDVDFTSETSAEKPVDDMQSTIPLISNVVSELQTYSAVSKPASNLKENCNHDPFATALILKFTNLDSVPSETNLNKIFSRFGPLKESETEVLKKSSRAKVVFRRRVDAETAFSSAGKYSIFGPALVSYRLKYMHSVQNKSSSDTTKQSRKDAISSEGNNT